jgi:hypothetical protein
MFGLQARMEIVRMPLKKKDRDRLFEKDLEKGENSTVAPCTTHGEYRTPVLLIRIHRIHMFLIGILLSLSKNSKKNLDFYCFLNSF